MSNAVTVKVIKLEDHFKDVLSAASGETLAKAVLAGGHVVEAYAKINANQVFSAKSTGGAGLAGSIHTVLVKSEANSAEADVGPSVIYGRIQELGGIIKPVHAKKLAIPLPGVKGSPRSYDLHVQSYGGMVAMLVDAAGKVMFWLKDSVHLPARPYLRPAVDEHQQEINDAIGYQLKAGIENATK